MPHLHYAIASPLSSALAWIALLPSPAAGQGASCQPQWLPAFGGIPGTNHHVNALAIFDDGTGPALYAAGTFNTAGGTAASGLAAFDGHSWSDVGGGISGPVGVPYALAVFDDGSGPALYVGGTFTSAGGVQVSHIAKWNGAGWAALGSGVGHAVFSPAVRALAVFDDGTGPALYAGGLFSTAGGVSATSIARWDGSTWSAVGGGVGEGATVNALAVFDDGGGPALYAGGLFTTAGGAPASNVAKWDGTNWSPLGAGTSHAVRALAAFDGPGGPALYVGGHFGQAGGAPAKHIARWNGASWSADQGTNGVVAALAVFDDGLGPALYAGGGFSTAGSIAASGIARWDGSWSALGSGVLTASSLPGTVNALGVFDDGGGATLVAGGIFLEAGELKASGVAEWDASGWSVLGDAGLSGPVRALAAIDVGGGSALYAGGDLTSAGGVPANRIAKWDGTSWSALGSGMNGTVRCLAEFDDGTGPALYAGGDFSSTGTLVVRGIAKWDGSSWSALGSGVSGPPGLVVRALAVFDDGSGPALYAGGDFTSAGGVPANRIAKWDGTIWSSLGSGVEAGLGITTVEALAIFDHGGGPALYVGGSFSIAGGVLAKDIASWDGSSWSALPPGGLTSYVIDLAVFDAGGGPELFAGGYFGIARWDGSSWSGFPGEITGSLPVVQAFAVFDGGGGPALYAGGSFSSVGGVPAGNIAQWNGSSWSPLGNGTGDVLALAVFDDGVGPALCAGGDFASSTAGDSYLAKWGCPVVETIPGCAANPATLAALAAGAPLGAPLGLSVTGAAASSGLAVVFLGQPGFDAGGCGLVQPGLGELLLALVPPPLLVASAALAGGTSGLSVLLPATPSLIGVTAHLQGAAIDPSLAAPVELANALAVKLGP